METEEEERLPWLLALLENELCWWVYWAAYVYGFCAVLLRFLLFGETSNRPR